MYRKSILFVLVLSLVLTSVVKADLIGWWKFEEGSGTLAADSSDFGNDGTVNGNAQWVEGYFGGGLELDGSSAWVAIDGIADDLTENRYTVSAWIKTTQTGDGNVVASNDTGSGHDFVFGVDGGNLLVEVDSVNTYPPAINDDEWHFIAYVRDGDQAFAYTDGDLVGEETPSGDQAGQARWSIGQEWDTNPSDFYQGVVDEVHIFNNPLSGDEIQLLMVGEGFAQAARPTPKDGAYIDDTWVALSWAPGDYAVSHDVYISDNFADVEAGAEAAFQGNQATSELVIGFPGMPIPEGLVNGTTYYWKIDEVNDADPNSPWIGNVWSFIVPSKTAYLPDPADGEETVATNVILKWTPGFNAKLHTVYFGESFEEVDSAAGGFPGPLNFNPGELQMAKTYYWRVDEFDPPLTHKGDVWSFTTEGAVAAISPVNGAVDVSQTPVLTWVPGFGASYDVYFGADSGSLELKASGNLGEESYEPGELEWNTTYFWRVDEANNANADSPWTGPLWSFTTADFLIIDDMEAYNDLPPDDPASNRIFNAWIDGFGDPTNGSLVGYANSPFAEQSNVHSGNQSMPFEYDNAAGKSEATLTLTSNNDWTINGVNRLTVWYRGANSNTAETMYVTLNGSASVDNDNPDAALASRWTEWNIDLQAFADQGVNLSNITSITLGLKSGTGGAGMLFFDDVSLHTPTP
ncbi:MAG: LamG domain-containing protein [Planctomycetes bacterium]|nr:LamG domain-containing protein [Planctomycetota bacterium]